MTTNQRTPLGLVSPGNLLNNTTSEESTGNISNAAIENGKSSQARKAESLYPDQIVYACAVTLGEKRNKKEYEVQKEAIIKVVCALLNSGGGIALVDIKNKDYAYTQHRVTIERSLDRLICNTTSENYYDMIQNGSLLYIFVKSWSTRAGSPRICSLDTGLYIRSFTSTYMADPIKVMNLIEEKTKNKRSRRDISSSIEGFQAFLDRDHLRLDEQLEFSESEYVELKDFSTEKKFDRISEVIPEYFSAFGNSAGGYLIIGVNDKSIVKGCGKGGERSAFKDLVERKVGKLKIVHTQQCQMDTSIFPYELHIKDVRDDQNKHSGYVIIMKIKKVCCFVFTKDPQSWMLESDSNDIKQLYAPDWINRMSPTPKARMLESQFTELSLSDRPPLAKPVYIKNGNESLVEVQEKLFGDLGSRIIIKPENLYTELSRENPELGDLLEKQLSKGHGILILSRSWAVDVGLQKNRNVVCDALLLATESYPTLYTVFKEDISQEEFEYSRLTALTIKKQLVNIGCYTGKLCVIPKALTLQKENQRGHEVITYPKVYQLVSLKDVEELLPSLLIIMLRFKSVLSDQMGNEFFNLLTTEQYELLSDCLESNRHLFVHGLPGSGKTVIALKIMERIKNMFGCSKEDILYICENQPLQYYISQQNVCVAVTRARFMLGTFPEIQHIIVDDGQNFRTENGDWFTKAKAIHKASKTGFFWLFLDYFQSCHRFETGLPPVINQSKQFLNKVVRNATTIYNFMLPKMEKIISNSHTSEFLRKIMSKSECCHPVEGSHVIQIHLDKKGIVRYVADHCYRYLKEGYSEKDIAVLCSTEETALEFTEELAPALLKRRLNRIRNANEIMKNAIVVDSIRRFSGLERCIVFVVNPVSLLPDIHDNILVIAASRASTKLHVLYEKK